jgi:hypothetical protein
MGTNIFSDISIKTHYCDYTYVPTTSPWNIVVDDAVVRFVKFCNNEENGTAEIKEIRYKECIKMNNQTHFIEFML